MSLESHPLVKKLEEKLLPQFDKVAAKIRAEIPNVDVVISSLAAGSLTQYQGWDFFIECFLKEIPYDESDVVFLEVGLGHLTTIPKIDASVNWGNPSGKSEAQFKDWSGMFPNNGIVATDEVLEDLYKDLPRLYEALFEALKRRKPADE